MPTFRLIALCAVSFFHVTDANSASEPLTQLIYEAVGPQAPQREFFDVSSTRVVWRSDDGTVRAQFNIVTDRLMGQSDGPVPWQDLGPRVTEARVGALREQLRALQEPLAAVAPDQREDARRRLGEMFRLRGPWAALEPAQASDLRLPLPATHHRVGERSCRSVLLHVGATPVARACDVEVDTVPGGRQVVTLLQAIASAEDALRERLSDPWPLVWSVHPLVTAARDGRLPLEVMQVLPGEARHGLRLMDRGSLPSAGKSGKPRAQVRGAMAPQRVN